MPVVSLLSVPYALLLKSEDHLDAVLARALGDAGVPSAIGETLHGIVTKFGELREANTAMARANVTGGIYRGDVVVDLPVDVVRYLIAYREATEELDRVCVGAGFPELAAPQDVVAYRRWAVEQVIGQVERPHVPSARGSSC